MDDALEEVEEELGKIVTQKNARSSDALEKAKEGIKEGRKVIQERQKMIRLADRSEYGWDLVNEYQADELAEDSDDEKKISKAEKSAEKKASKRKRSSGSGLYYAASKRRAWDTRGQTSKPGGQSWEPKGTTMPRQSSWPGMRSPAAGPSNKIGPCFKCGEFGHIKVDCKSRASSNKYPLSTSSRDSVTTGVKRGVSPDCPV